MAFRFPFSTLHELNLDWILEKVKYLTENNEEFNTKADYAVETAEEAKTIAEQAILPDGAVTTPKIADYAVTQVKLAVNAVGNYQLQDSAVNADKLASDSVTTAKIDDGAVTADKIDSGAVTTAKIDDEAITRNKLSDETGTYTKTDPDNIIGSEYANGVISVAGIKFFSFSVAMSVDSATTTHELYSIPSGFVPEQNYQFLITTQSGSMVQIFLQTNGTLSIKNRSGNAISSEFLYTTLTYI